MCRSPIIKFDREQDRNSGSKNELLLIMKTPSSEFNIPLRLLTHICIIAYMCIYVYRTYLEILRKVLLYFYLFVLFNMYEISKYILHILIAYFVISPGI